MKIKISKVITKWIVLYHSEWTVFSARAHTHAHAHDEKNAISKIVISLLLAACLNGRAGNGDWFHFSSSHYGRTFPMCSKTNGRSDDTIKQSNENPKTSEAMETPAECDGTEKKNGIKSRTKRLIKALLNTHFTNWKKNKLKINTLQHTMDAREMRSDNGNGTWNDFGACVHACVGFQ